MLEEKSKQKRARGKGREDVKSCHSDGKTGGEGQARKQRRRRRKNRYRTGQEGEMAVKKVERESKKREHVGEDGYKQEEGGGLKQERTLRPVSSQDPGEQR